ncbi:MAG: hypothetical protein RLY30_453 [Pseudomonadota bacterium]
MAKRMGPTRLKHSAVDSQILSLWGCTIGTHLFDDASSFNPLLARILSSIRAMDASSNRDAPFYASSDDLLHRIKIPEWEHWVRFLIDCIGKTARVANGQAWQQDAENLAVELRGLWCQFTNRGAHHDIHTHGNCSWSGVYVVQVDPDESREQHPVFSGRNGVTRFYGPYFQTLGGASMDYGNAYLQQSHIDITPVTGRLVVFPSWLPHQALPYQGESDRIILSFNASIHRQGGDQWAGYSAA